MEGGLCGWGRVVRRQKKPLQRVGIACLAVVAAPLSLIEKSAEIENCDRKLQAALGGKKGTPRPWIKTELNANEKDAKTRNGKRAYVETRQNDDSVFCLF